MADHLPLLLAISAFGAGVFALVVGFAFSVAEPRRVRRSPSRRRAA